MIHICVPDTVKNLNVKVLNLMSRTNETRHINGMKFSYGPYLCDGCYNILQKCNKLKNIAIAHVKKSAYRIYFLYMSTREAKKLMINSKLIDKKGVL